MLSYMAELEQNRLERERAKQQQQLAHDKQICKAYVLKKVL